MVADEDGGRGLQVSLTRDLERHAAGVSGEVGEEARDVVVDGVALVEHRKDDRDETAHDRHDEGREQDDHALAHELGLLGQVGEERR